MELSSSSTIDEIVETARRISKDHLAASAEQTDRERRFPRSNLDALAEAALQGSITHATSRQYEHAVGSLADIETIQHLLAEMKLSIDRTRSLLRDTAQMVEANDPQAMLPVLEIKAAACETALEVTGKAMRVCGGAAYSRRIPVERYFRDSQAGNVMAPTTDMLKGFIGKALVGLPLF